MKLESCASGGSRERVGNKAVFRGTGTTPGTWTPPDSFRWAGGG